MVISATKRTGRHPSRPIRRALVVEDDESLGSKFKRIIERAGVSVDVANSRSQAIEQVQSHQYAVALVDIMLCDDPADRGGIEVIERLSALGSRTAVIVVSATNDVRVPVQAWKCGAFRYLVKKDIRSSEDLLAPVLDALRIVGLKKPAAEGAHGSSDEESCDGTRTGGTPNQTCARFEQLATAWEEEAQPMASPVEMAMLPTYQEIVGMGPAAVPLILKRLRSSPDHWYWALRAITGANPVRADDAGNVDAMARAWVDWGRERGLLDE